MDCSRRTCSSRPPVRTDLERLLLVCLGMAAAAGCGHAGERDSTATPESKQAELLCVPSDSGFLRARLNGAIDAELNWSADVPQCRGGLRPTGDGVRLLFK